MADASSIAVAFDGAIFALQKFGGISRYFAKLAVELNSCGVSATVVAPVYRNVYLTSSSAPVYGRYLNDFPLRAAGIVSRTSTFLSHYLIKHLAHDVLHCTHYALPKSSKKPIVVTIHDMIDELEEPQFTSSAKRNAAAVADHIICVSECTKRDLKRIFNIPDAKISVIYHGVDSVPPPPRAPRTHPRPFLLYVGQRGGYKNFSAFLNAYASSRRLRDDFDVILFGGGAPLYEEAAEFERLGVGDHIHYRTGDDPVLASYYSTAAALIYPSRYEGFGLPVLEAMSYGCPLVVSNAASLPEVAGLAAEYFDPASSDDLRDAVTRVVYCQSRTDELRQQGKEHIRGFTWGACASRTREVYRKVA